MTAIRLRPLAAMLLAFLAAVMVAVTSTLTPALVSRLEKLVADVAAEIALLADEGWIMTGTGQADPTIGPYMDLIKERFLQPDPAWFAGQTTFPDYTFHGLTTPEQFCPIVCQPLPVPQLTFGDSLTEGVANLDDAIRSQLEAGDNVAVFGFSQSAVIATLEMQKLLADEPGGDYDPENLHVVLIGDPNSPIGGLLTRLDVPGEQHIPLLNIPVSIGATPTEPFATDIYTNEYDGWAAFPQDPANLLAVVNALMGIGAVHSLYPTADNLGDTISLGSIGETNFYMVPEQLPILGPVYQLGDFGKILGDTMAPGLKLAIDWSYGNPGDPDGGIPMDGVDPIGAAGPWAVTATGQLSEDTGVGGFLLRMDPLQMLAGIQYASVQSLVNPINDILELTGQDPLPDSVVDSLLWGYDFTNHVDQWLLNGWTDLADSLNVADVLGPDAIFNGAPLISGEPLLGLVGAGLGLFDFLDTL